MVVVVLVVLVVVLVVKVIDVIVVVVGLVIVYFTSTALLLANILVPNLIVIAVIGVVSVNNQLKAKQQQQYIEK